MGDRFTFAETLNTYINRSRYSSKVLAELSNVSERTIEKWRAAEVQRPQIVDGLLKVAAALRLDVNETTTLLNAASYRGVSDLLEQARRDSDEQLLWLLKSWSIQPASISPDLTDVEGVTECLTDIHRSGTNPFEYGPAVPPERFYGRTSNQADIKNRIGGISAQCISIVGLRRSGKSSLLRYIRERSSGFCSDEQRPLLVLIDMQDQRFHTPTGLIEGLRRAIERQTGTSPWQNNQNNDPWSVEDGLERLRNSGRRLIVLIDEFERISVRLDQFQDWGEDWRAKASAGYIAMVIATTRPLPEIYQACGMTSPFTNIFTSTILGAFNTSEWQMMVCEGFLRGGGIASPTDLRLIDDLAGGLPFYTQMAAALLWQHNDYGRVRAAFEQQAGPRFVELWDDLRPAERQALHYAAGVPGSAPPAESLRDMLYRYGVLRDDGRLFSSALAVFVRERQ